MNNETLVRQKSEHSFVFPSAPITPSPAVSKIQCQTGPIRIGEIGGLDVPLLVGSVFYDNHSLLINPSTGAFDKNRALKRLDRIGQLADQYGLQAAIDVIGSTGIAMERYLHFMVKYFPYPVLINGTDPSIRIKGLQTAAELGILDRVIYSSLTADWTRLELQTLEQYTPAAIIVLTQHRENPSPEGSLEFFEQTLLPQLTNLPQERLIIEVPINDAASIGIALQTIPLFRHRYPNPIMCSVANALPQWKGLATMDVTPTRWSLGALLSLCRVAGANILHYGPIEYADSAFHLIASCEVSLGYATNFFQGVTIPKNHPLKSMGRPNTVPPSFQGNLTSRERCTTLFQESVPDQCPVDIGSSSITALGLVSWRCLAGQSRVGTNLPSLYTSPLSNVPLLPEELRTTWYSDVLRTGTVYPAGQPDQSKITDEYGGAWLREQNQEPAPIIHPLAHADLQEILRHPRPRRSQIYWPAEQLGTKRNAAILCDAPSPGLLELCFRLRGWWQFLDDLAHHPRMANALLDWAMETIIGSYEDIGNQLPETPDMVLYGDDFGHQFNMFFSEEPFRVFLKPRMQTIFVNIQRSIGAPILFHTCGAVKPILKDLCNLGVSALNLQLNAEDMGVKAVRQHISHSVLLHGGMDFLAIGEAVDQEQLSYLESTLRTINQAWPYLPSPSDQIPSLTNIQRLQLAAQFLKTIDLEQLLPPASPNFRKIAQLALYQLPVESETLRRII